MRINQITQPEQLDELNWKDIQKGAKKVSKGAQKFTKNVADTGAAVGQAAKDVGGAIGQVGKTAIADPLSATYNAAKRGLTGAADVTGKVYGDVKAGAQRVGKGVAGAVGDVAGAAGAVAGGATTGVGRAAANGFNAGAQAVGGDAADPLARVFKQQPANTAQASSTEQDQPYATSATGSQAVGGEDANIASIKQQIAKKQSEIQNLQAQLATAMAAASTASEPSKVGNIATKAGEKTANALGGLAAAWQKGAQNPGPAWGSVADTGSKAQTQSNTVEVPGEQGNNFKYTKQGNQWVGADNKPVTDPAVLAMIKKQAATPAPAATAPAPAAPATAPTQSVPPATQTPTAGAPAATTAPTAAPAPAQSFRRGQQTVTPSKVTLNMPAAKKPAPAASKPVAEPVAESVDIAESLWRKMKKKR
jgi:hypothetical protein